MENTATAPSNVLGIIYALAAALCFGILVPASKLLLEALAPLQLASLVLVGAGIGTACLVAVRAALKKGVPDENVTGADAPKLALMAALNAGAVACLAFGLVPTLAANASVLMGFEIASATVFGWILFNRHVCYKAIVAVGLISLASFLLCWNVAGPIAFVPESLLIVAAGALRGLEGGFKRSLGSKDPLQIACIRSLGAGAVLFALSCAVDGLPSGNPGAVANALLLGVATFGFGAVMHLSGQRKLGSARSEGYFALAPFVGMIVSWAWFGFALEPLFFGALALMALGVWLAMDDSVFHEDAFAALDRERMALYSGEAVALDFDRMHRPLSQ